jgi:hypothetical protein
VHEFEEWTNELSDCDEAWGPLLFLRPSRKARIGNRRVLVLAGMHGGFWGMLGNVVLALMARFAGGVRPAVYILPLGLTLAYFVLYRLTIAQCWNRRARRLKRLQALVQRPPLDIPRGPYDGPGDGEADGAE